MTKHVTFVCGGSMMIIPTPKIVMSVLIAKGQWENQIIYVGNAIGDVNSLELKYDRHGFYKRTRQPNDPPTEAGFYLARGGYENSNHH